MKKISILLSILVLAAMLLTACGGGEEKNEGNQQIPTTIPPTLPSTTAEATSAVTGTGTVTAGNTTTTPGIPVTGGENPARLSKELDFKVWDKDGNQIGDVKDMVLDFDNAKAAYVVVGSGGFLGIGEKNILVPWNSLKLQADPKGGQENGFVLQTDVNAFKNAPDFDLSTLPALGQPAGNWDAQIHTFWQNPSAAANATNTPAANATTAPTMTPTMTATANPNNGNATGTNVVALKGVALASKLLGSTVTLANQTGTGANGTGNTAGNNANTATATPAANNGGAQATATVGSAVATVTAVAGPSTGNNLSATVKDMIMDTKAGKVQFVVVDAKFDDGEHWIPVPLKLFQWDLNAQAFVLKADAAMLQKAPFFQEDQFPNTATSGWDNEFNKFWQK